jgi:selenocysteine lyase/cysteine desulfurase
VVGFREEFPANFFPWKRLESRGVAATWLSAPDPLERIEEAVKGARLLAISFVQYLSGFRAPLRQIGQLCRRHGCIFLVDAIQGLGAFPVDVRACHIDALCAGGHKWLLGPEGCAVLYIGRELQERVEPVEFGWTNVAHYSDYASRDMRLRADAGRYECGTLNTVGCLGLKAAIELLLEAGVEAIGQAILALAGRLIRGVEEQGYQVLGEFPAENRSGIVSFRKPGAPAAELVRRLRERGVITAARNGWVRASPHFYIAPDEIERLLEALP